MNAQTQKNLKKAGVIVAGAAIWLGANKIYNQAQEIKELRRGQRTETEQVADPVILHIDRQMPVDIFTGKLVRK